MTIPGSWEHWIQQIQEETDRMLGKRIYGTEKDMGNEVSKKTIQGEVELADVNVLPQGSRCGNVHRDKTINHIVQMADKGYLTHDEATRRVQYVENADKHATLNHLTSDLPAPVHKEPLDWDEPVVYVPTLVAGMIISALGAALPVAELTARNGFAIGMLITGIISFFACLVGVIAKAIDA